jgi:hypothetical protein
VRHELCSHTTNNMFALTQVAWALLLRKHRVLGHTLYKHILRVVILNKARMIGEENWSGMECLHSTRHIYTLTYTIHTCMHACAHTYIHTRARASAIHNLAREGSSTWTRSIPILRKHRKLVGHEVPKHLSYTQYTRTHTRTHTHTHMHTHANTHTHTHKHKHTHTNTNTLTHKHTRKRDTQRSLGRVGCFEHTLESRREPLLQDTQYQYFAYTEKTLL